VAGHGGAPRKPPTPNNGIAWVYGAGGIQYVFARDPKLDVTTYRPEEHQQRLLEVSQLMDSTNPDLGRFRARGGKLIMLEHMADYAQSPYAGIRYFENVERKLGKAETTEFARLYTAPGVDHVGSGAPANVDMLSVLVDWVEKGSGAGRSGSRRAEGGSACVCRPPRVAAVPMAGLATLQGWRFPRARRASCARNDAAELSDLPRPKTNKEAPRASRFA